MTLLEMSFLSLNLHGKVSSKTKSRCKENKSLNRDIRFNRNCTEKPIVSANYMILQKLQKSRKETTC